MVTCYAMHCMAYGRTRYRIQIKKAPRFREGLFYLEPGGVLLYSGHPALRPSGRCKQRSKPLPAVLSHAHVRVDTRYRIQIKKPLAFAKGCFIWSLAVSYSHMGKPHTTIGADMFHF